MFMMVKQFLNSFFRIIPVLMISFVGIIAMQIISSKWKKAYILQSIFVSLPGFAIGITGFIFAQNYVFRLFGIVLIIIGIAFIAGAVACYVFKYKKKRGKLYKISERLNQITRRDEYDNRRRINLKYK